MKKATEIKSNGVITNKVITKKEDVKNENKNINLNGDNTMNKRNTKIEIIKALLSNKDNRLSENEYMKMNKDRLLTLLNNPIISKKVETETETETETENKEIKGNNKMKDTTTTTEITSKSTIKDIKAYLTLNQIVFNTKDTKDTLMQLVNDNKDLNAIKDILANIKKDDKVIKKAKEDKQQLEDKAVPLMLNLIKLKSENNVIFNALSKKEKLKTLKKDLSTKNNLIKDTLTFLLHNNLKYSNDINIANIRGINTLISKKVNVKSRLNHTMNNEDIAKVLKDIRKEIKDKEIKALKLLREKAIKFDEVKNLDEVKKALKPKKIEDEVTITKKVA